MTQARVGANGMEGLTSPSSLSDALNPQSVAGCIWVPFDSMAGENHSCSDPRNDFQIKAARSLFTQTGTLRNSFRLFFLELKI